MDKKFVSYEDFGAVGDGIHDDLPAIVEAHRYANEQGLPVRARDGAIYYIGGKDLTATVKTDVNFGEAQFIIDDRSLENVKAYVFEVVSDHEVYTPDIASLEKGQRKIDFPHEGRTYVRVFNSEHRIFLRKGENANNGTDATDCFVVDADGNIENEINRDYPVITRVYAKSIDDTPITVEGGVFTTIANRWERVYNYHYRGFSITRSNVTVKNVTHYVEDEGESGAPYNAFFAVTEAADVEIRDCLLTPHKTYMTLDSKPPERVNRMGTYELNFTAAIRPRLIRVTQSRDITDNRYWGLIGSNFSKEFYIEGCEMSRFDAHMGVSGAIIKNSKIGHQCLQLIGYGDFVIEDSYVLGYSFISLRADYGSIWLGTIKVKNCTWKPLGKGDMYIISAHNSGDHNFGYECRMPELIEIDGLRILDGDANEGSRVYFLPNYDPEFNTGKPFPYVPVKKAVASGVVTECNREVNKYPRADEYAGSEVIVR